MKAILPYLLVLYFLIKAKKIKLYLLGIPFLQFMGQSIFFEMFQLPWLFGKFQARLDSNKLIFGYLILAWFCCTKRYNKNRWIYSSKKLSMFQKGFLKEEWILLAIFILWIIDILVTLLSYGGISNVDNQLLSVGYMVVGFFMVREILFNFSQKEIIDFLGALVFVNTIAAVLYILHQGLQLPIYSGPEYVETTFLNQRITRTFYFMPPLLSFSIAYLLSKPKWSLKIIIFFIITLLAILISYTRFLVMLALFLSLLSILLRTIKKHQKVAALKRGFILAIIGVIFIWVVSSFFSAQIQYFMSRMNRFISGIDDPSNNSIFIRLNFLSQVWEMIRNINVVLGFGFPSEFSFPQVLLVNQMAADSAWVPILFRMGIIGVILFLLILLSFCFRIFKIYYSNSKYTEILALIFILYMIAVIVESFLTSSFMYWERYPLGLWFLAIISVEAKRKITDVKIENDKIKIYR